MTDPVIVDNATLYLGDSLEIMPRHVPDRMAGRPEARVIPAARQVCGACGQRAQADRRSLIFRPISSTMIGSFVGDRNT